MLRTLISVVLWAFALLAAVAGAVEVPIAMHQLVALPPGGGAVVRLKGFDTKNPKMVFSVTNPPATGSLYQLSSVYSNHNIDPKAGTPIRAVAATNVTGSNNRVYYRRPSPDVDKDQAWDTFQFSVYNGNPRTSAGGTSYKGTVTLVSSSGTLMSSSFLLNNEDWTIVGNKKSMTSATYEPYSRGSSLNHYIINTDDNIHIINMNGNNNGITNPVAVSLTNQKTDASLWYFHAPSRYYSNLGISYTGTLQFTLGFFSGDLTSLNSANTNVVELECSQCVGPVTKGIKLAYKMGTLLAKQKLAATGSTTFSIPLVETSGWLIDSQNTLVPDWRQPTQCELIQVLSALSSINVLGDWTTWYETVALDNFKIVTNTKLAATPTNSNLGNVVPICAQVRPDASVCTCGQAVPVVVGLA